MTQKRKIFLAKSMNMLLLLGSFVALLVVFVHYEDKVSFFEPIITRLTSDKYYFNRAITKVSYKPSTDVLGTSDKITTLSLPVLAYHGIVTEPNEAEDVDYQDFKKQMFMLKDYGYKTITLKQMEEFLIEKKPLPAKSFLLTFDDARKDSFYPADPILKELNFTAVMFVIGVNTADKDNFHLTFDELKNVVKTGRWELQSHGYDAHQRTDLGSGKSGYWLPNRIWLTGDNRTETTEEYQKRILSDMEKSKKLLEESFGVSVNSYAYPFGEFGQAETNYPESKNTILEVTRSVYKFAYYMPRSEIGFRNYPGRDNFLIRRLSVGKGKSAEDLLLELEASEDKDIGFTDNFETKKGWLTEWGASITTENRLHLYSFDGTSGATTFLNGSELWKDYEISVDVSIGKETDTFSILTRVDRAGNYSGCSYTVDAITYTERLNGKIINGPKAKFTGISGTVKLGARVKDNITQCLINNKTVLTSKIIALTDNQGMIGFSVWSSKSNAQANLQSFTSQKIITR